MASPSPSQSIETSIPIENGKQLGIIVTSALSIAVPMVLVGLRLWARRIAHRSLDASDATIFAALILNIGLHIDMYVMCLYGGFGFHGPDIVQRFGMDTLALFLKGILAFPILWNCTVCLSKLSVLLMYTTIIPMRKMIIACRVVGAFIVLWNIGAVLGALLLCRPVAFNWDKTLPGECGDTRLFYMYEGAINVVAEATCLLLPVPFLYRLQMKTSKKLVVMGLFSVGWMTFAVTIYRQVSLPYLHFEDMTYTGVLATIFTGMEPAIALSLTCVPFLWPLLRGSSAATDSNTERTDASKKNTSGRMRGSFKKLNDDSSEIQLQPLSSDELKYEAQVSQDQHVEHEVVSSRMISVKKGWEVVSMERPE